MSARRFEDLFRPAHEGAAAIGWLTAAFVMIFYSPPYWWILTPMLAGMAVLRASEVIRLWKFRASITLSRMRTIKLSELMARLKLLSKTRQILPIGVGFQWSQRHIEIANQILNRNADELPDVPQFIKTELARLEGIPKGQRSKLDKISAKAIGSILPSNTKPVLDSDIGSPWIHGIGFAEEKQIGIPFSALPGHTMITGTTRAGKTRLYESLSAQIIGLPPAKPGGPPPALIVIDPKKDSDWVSMLNIMCQKTGANFSTSTRPNPTRASGSTRYRTGTTSPSPLRELVS